MTTKKPTNDPSVTELLTTAPDEWEFETVSEDFPTKVQFDTIGDTFVGRFSGTEKVVPNEGGAFELYMFEGRDGDRYSIGASTRLRSAMENVTIGQWVRITYIGDIPTTQANPMKDFRVDVRRK